MEPTKKKQFLPDIRLVKFEQRVDSFNHLLQMQILFGNRKLYKELSTEHFAKRQQISYELHDKWFEDIHIQ